MASINLYRFLFPLTLLILGSEVKGQTFAEWFKQKSTQKKYLLQQIEALQVYSTYLKKGYAVAKGGLGSIGGALLTENSLHQSYYQRLVTVDPATAKSGQVKDLINWQQDIIKLFTAIERLNGLSQAERNYLTAVRNMVYDDSERLINILQNVLSDHQMQMNDADRIKLIQKLHGEMQENYRFTAGFTAQAKTYSRQRKQELKNNQVMKQAYALN